MQTKLVNLEELTLFIHFLVLLYYLYQWNSAQYGYWHCPHGRASICNRLSVRMSHQQQRWPAGLLLSALLAGDIDRQRRAPVSHAGALSSTALSSKCGQCHVDSAGTMPNTDLFGVGFRSSFTYSCRWRPVRWNIGQLTRVACVVFREKLFEMFNHSLLSASARSKWMTGWPPYID